MPRQSLRDRNRAAYRADPETPDLEPPAAPSDSATPPDETSEPAPKQATEKAPQKATGKAPESRTRPKEARRRVPASKTPASTGETARLGIYLTPAEFGNAKAAYLTDWTHGGTADTFAKWIAAAIDAHAARTPEERAATAQPKGRAEERTGSTRSFSIPTDTVGRMRAAITADHQGGRWPSDSAWCGEAIAHAVDAARAKNGGTLPTPPPRLPNRLVR